MAAYIVRMMRTSVIDVLASEYVTMARLKGLPAHRVLLRHALPSALLPTLNVIAINASPGSSAEWSWWRTCSTTRGSAP